MPKIYFKEEIVAKWVFKFLVTKTYYWNMLKTWNGHNEKWYDPYLQSAALNMLNEMGEH